MRRDDLTEPERDELFHTFEYTAFRLEPRESYAGVGTSAGPFGRWLAGDPVLQDPEHPWYRNVRAQTVGGKKIARVRVVSEPWSDYSRYGLWACQVNLAAGEDIRYLSRHTAEEAGLPVSLPGHDYWLFDSRLLVVLRFDDTTNDILSWEIVDDPAVIVRHNYWRDAAWHHALPRDEYVRGVGEPVRPPSPAGM